MFNNYNQSMYDTCICCDPCNKTENTENTGNTETHVHTHTHTHTHTHGSSEILTSSLTIIDESGEQLGSLNANTIDNVGLLLQYFKGNSVNNSQIYDSSGNIDDDTFFMNNATKINWDITENDIILDTSNNQSENLIFDLSGQFSIVFNIILKLHEVDKQEFFWTGGHSFIELSTIRLIIFKNHNDSNANEILYENKFEFGGVHTSYDTNIPIFVNMNSLDYICVYLIKTDNNTKIKIDENTRIKCNTIRVG